MSIQIIEINVPGEIPSLVEINGGNGPQVVEINQGAQGEPGESGPPGPNVVNINTTSDGTANLDVATITGDGSGLTGLKVTRVFADQTEVNSAIPDFVGQLAINTSDQSLYQASTLNAGDWSSYIKLNSFYVVNDIVSDGGVIGTNIDDFGNTIGNSATTTALATARNIFGISFDGTANVSGDATNAGHFASIPVGGTAGHFITLNGTAPTVIAGRSAWFSDGSGVPSFRNGTGSVVTITYSGGPLGTPSSGTLTNCTGLPVSSGISGLGTGVATALAVNVGSAGAFVTFNGALGTPSSGTLTNCTIPASAITGTTLASNVVTSSLTAVGTIATGTWQGTAIAIGYGGTGSTSNTSVGALLYGTGTTTRANLAGNTSTTMAVLTQTGNGTASAAPVWTSTTGTGNVVRDTSPTITTAIIATGSTTGAFGIGGTSSSFGSLRDAGAVLGVPGSVLRNSANTADAYFRANIIATYNASLDFSINAANAANNSTRISINKGDLGTIQADGNGAFCWGTAGTDQRTLTPDTGISRVSAGVVGVGTGAAGSIAGQVRAATAALGTSSPSSKAILDCTSTTLGFLPPRMTTTQRDAITTPPAGLMIYNTSTNKLNFYNGSAWEAVTSA